MDPLVPVHVVDHALGLTSQETIVPGKGPHSLLVELELVRKDALWVSLQPVSLKDTMKIAEKIKYIYFPKMSNVEIEKIIILM